MKAKTFKKLWFGLLIAYFIVMGALVGFTKWTVLVVSIILVSYLATVWKQRKEIIRLIGIGLKNRNIFFWGYIKISIFYVVAITMLAVFVPNNPVITFIEFYAYAFIVIISVVWFHERGKLFDNHNKNKTNENCNN